MLKSQKYFASIDIEVAESLLHTFCFFEEKNEKIVDRYNELIDSVLI